MTKKQTLNGNRLIAKFHGWSEKGKTVQGEMVFSVSKPVIGSLKHVRESSFEYHSSWDWIMLIVEQIESIIDNNVKISSFCEITFWYDKKKNNFDLMGGKYNNIIVSFPPHFPERFVAKSKIESVWIACVEFIKWYNETVKI